jgi:Flp pilus assembly pilin Flp
LRAFCGATPTITVTKRARTRRSAPIHGGTTAIEYGLIVAVVAIGIVVGLGSLRDGLNTILNNEATVMTK